MLEKLLILRNFFTVNFILYIFFYVLLWENDQENYEVFTQKQTHTEKHTHKHKHTNVIKLFMQIHFQRIHEPFFYYKF